MKVIDLTDRVMFSDDIIGIYVKGYYYYVKTRNGDYCIEKEDYYKLKEYLLSLNEPIYEELPKEDKKITKLNTNWQYAFDTQVEQDTIELICKKINEIIDKVNGEDNDNNKK